MHFQLLDNIIFMCVAGSHAYGTNIESSDIDVRGVTFVPQTVRESPFYNYESLDGQWDILRILKKAPVYNGVRLTKHDTQIHSVTKFVQLAANANPNILETLFMPERNWLAYTAEWEVLQDKRELFLSQKVVHTYTGYAHSQLKKIRSHREWLFNKPTHEPTREEFGLPKQPEIDIDTRNKINEEVDLQIRQWNMEDIPGLDGAMLDVIRGRMFDYRLTFEVFGGHTDLQAAGVKLNLSTEALRQLHDERRFKQAVKKWKQYMDHFNTRNKARNELEEKYGYDTKHGMHLVRLMRTGLELMQNKPLIVRRPDAEELIAIRNGSLSYDQIIELAESLELQITEARQSCKLPKGPNTEAINDLLMQVLYMR